MSGPDRIVFDSGLVRIGAFRCEPAHPSFEDSGRIRNACFVFPRTAVEIQHEHERAFVANPNVVTLYNRHDAYRRSAISPDGDRCDWFAVDEAVLRDVVRAFDPGVEERPDKPFRFTRGFSDASTYLAQRTLFSRAAAANDADPLAIEEGVLMLLERVVRSTYPASGGGRLQETERRRRELVHHVESIISARWDEPLHLGDIAREAGASAYHLCRVFRRATHTTLHQYRHRLRIRLALERVCESNTSMVDIALQAGFSSHSHFTSAFREEFGDAPSALRRARN